MSDSLEPKTPEIIRMTDGPDELLDKDSARKMLGGIGNTKLYQLLKNGDLIGHKMGKRLFIKMSEIRRFLNNLPVYQSSAPNGR